MVRFWTALVVVALVAPAGERANAADQLIAGRKLSIADRSGRQQTTFMAKSPTIVAPTPQGADDPTVAGATLKIVNPTSGETASLDLPSSNWSVNSAKVLLQVQEPGGSLGTIGR